MVAVAAVTIMGIRPRTKAEPGGGEVRHVPTALKARLANLQAAYKNVATAAQGDDREAVREALGEFQKAIEGIDAKELEGHAAMLWKELAMRLRNDTVEGRWAASPARAHAALASLTADFQQLRDQFGLTDGPSGGKRFEVPENFRQQLGRLWESYLAAQDALAGDDRAKAQMAAGAALKSLQGVDMSLLSGEAHDVWMRTHADVEAAAETLSGADDLEAQRQAFATLSEALRDVVASFGLGEKSGTVYQLRCAMAFDGQGARWLQADDEVRNPYFGPAMLKCANDVELIWDGPPAGSDGPGSVVAPEAFQSQLVGLLNAYLSVQQALASDNLAKSRQAVQAFQQTLKGIDGKSLEGEARNVWTRERADLQKTSGRLTEARDLKSLREAFALVSEEIPVVLESFGVEPNRPVYRLHCPMAFGGRGASWLQKDDQAKNPYFGATMLRCADKIEQIAGRPVEEGRTHE